MSVCVCVRVRLIFVCNCLWLYLSVYVRLYVCVVAYLRERDVWESHSDKVDDDIGGINQENDQHRHERDARLG